MAGRRIPLDEAAVEFQVGLRDLRRTAAAPLWEAAIASGRWDALSDAKALAGLLQSAERLARRIAGSTRASCADGLLEPGHGRAA